MCNLCKRGGTNCQDCGVMICFDVKQGDDILDRAYVTASGDLYCYRCGKRADEAEEREYEYGGYEFDEDEQGE